jgi:hypothetical protein
VGCVDWNIMGLIITIIATMIQRGGLIQLLLVTVVKIQVKGRGRLIPLRFKETGFIRIRLVTKVRERGRFIPPIIRRGRLIRMDPIVSIEIWSSGRRAKGRGILIGLLAPRDKSVIRKVMVEDWHSGGSVIKVAAEAIRIRVH